MSAMLCILLSFHRRQDKLSVLLDKENIAYNLLYVSKHPNNK